MDQNFQTSFIPKKPVVHERTEAKRPTGLLVIFSVLILFTVFVAYGGVYFYKNSLTQSITSKEKALELARNRFEPGRLSELKTLDRRIKAANGVLANHVAPSPIFKILEATTMKTIRYTSFSYELKENGMVFVKLTGEANGYRSIALQSDLLTQNKDIMDPVFSNLALDTKGSVLFDLTFSVQESLVSYKENLTKGAYAEEEVYESVDTGAGSPLELEGNEAN